MSEETLALINRCKAYLALQHQGLIDPWMAYDIITSYEKELANV